MLKKQEKFLEYLNQISDLLKNTIVFNDEIDVLAEQIKQTELIVPVVGSFSAGKSTLINSFLGDNVLPIDITPETALATELRFSTKNYIEAIKADGAIDKYEIDQQEIIKEKSTIYKYIKLYLNNENLKKIEPLVLVDMPGFDSPLDLHNKAILTYLNKGAYFVVLINIEDGTIPQSVLMELENIMEFGKGFSFCLSKTNLRPENDVKEILDQVQEQLEDHFDIKDPVIPLTKNGGENLAKILNTINPEELFKEIFIDTLKDLSFQIEGSINTSIHSLTSSKKEAQQAIEHLRLDIRKMNDKKEEMILEIKLRYSDQNVDWIVDKIGEALKIHQSYLVKIALQNNDNFSREMNLIIKNTLIRELNKTMEEISKDIVDDLIRSIEISKSLSNFQVDNNWLVQRSDQIKGFLLKAQSGLKNLDSTKLSGSKWSKYKIITTIAGLTTSILNPLLEAVIIFLPEIISFFTKNKAEQQMNNRFLHEIVPSVKTRLRNAIPPLLEEQINQLIKQVSFELEKQLEQKQQEIQKAQEEKQANISELNLQINKLQNLKEQVVSLSNSVLYKGE